MKSAKESEKVNKNGLPTQLSAFDDSDDTIYEKQTPVRKSTPHPRRWKWRVHPKNSKLSTNKNQLAAISHARNNTKKQPSEHSELSQVKLSVIKKILRPGYSCFRKVIWVLVLITCTAVCLWQVCDRLIHYLQNPTVFHVSVDELNKIMFPAITLCPAIDVDELLNGYNDEHLNVEQFWEELRIHNRVQVFGSCTSDQRTCNYDEGTFINSVTNRTMLTFFGRCLVLEPTLFLDYRGVSTWLSIDIPNEVQSEAIYEKPTYAALFFIHDHGPLYRHDAYYLTSYLTEDYETDLQVTVKEYTYVPRTLTPCTDEVALTDCINDCVDKVLAKTLDCRLPFMKSSQLPTCTTVDGVFDMRNKTVDFYTTFDASQCLCGKPCKRRIFTGIRTERKSMKENATRLVIRYTSNIMETVTEKQSYSFPALLSDIGGSLGFYLGFCVFTVLELVEVFVDVVMNRLVKLNSFVADS